MQYDLEICTEVEPELDEVDASHHRALLAVYQPGRPPAPRSELE